MSTIGPVTEPLDPQAEPRVVAGPPRVEWLYFALRNHKLVIGASVVLLALLLALVGPLLTDADPFEFGYGTGLQPSPPDALRKNTAGYVDHVDVSGQIVGRDELPPEDAIYTRRWSIEPLPTNPNNTLILQVLVTRNRDRGNADEGSVARLRDEARVITVKTRKAQ